MAHLCVPQNQALGVCRGFVPDIQICGTHGRKNLVNATIISNAEEEEEVIKKQKKTKKTHTHTQKFSRMSTAKLSLSVFWPEDTEVGTKLWGQAAELQRTADFLAATGLRI